MDTTQTCNVNRIRAPEISDSVAGGPLNLRFNLLMTPGCFGVGVKFGPVLGELAADRLLGSMAERPEELAAACVRVDGVDVDEAELAGAGGVGDGMNNNASKADREEQQRLMAEVY